MARIEGSTVIARPVEEVFDFVADERNEPAYNARMVRAEKVTAGPVSEGTRWAVTVMSGGRRIDMTVHVDHYARPNTLGTTTTTATARTHGTITFAPTQGGTRLRWCWDLRPKGVLRPFAPLIARASGKQEAELWAALKKHLESAATSRR